MPRKPWDYADWHGQLAWKLESESLILSGHVIYLTMLEVAPTIWLTRLIDNELKRTHWNNRSLLYSTVPVFIKRDRGKPRETPGYTASGLRVEPATFRLRKGSVKSGPIFAYISLYYFFLFCLFLVLNCVFYFPSFLLGRTCSIVKHVLFSVPSESTEVIRFWTERISLLLSHNFEIFVLLILWKFTITGWTSDYNLCKVIYHYLSICHYEMLSLREIPFSLVKSELLELQELKFRLRTEFKLHARLEYSACILRSCVVIAMDTI
jgi:hypothetical protein